MPRRVNPESRWILLAVDPHLAGLPWQDLFRRVDERETIVSLVPNFGWITGSYHRAWQSSSDGLALVMSDEDEDLRPLAERIRQDRPGISAQFGSAAIVLGHGVWKEDVPSVRIGRSALTLEEWMRAVDRRVCVVHSCYGGRADHRFLGDIGQLPGLALALGCRLFIAPVAEVPLAAATALHDHLVRANGPREIGLRYLEAIREHPAVALYNLYGFGNERTHGHFAGAEGYVPDYGTRPAVAAA
ncbi:MAG TPA: hypothetical protein VGO40_16195 [Longimicrobium sp.]|jgi:hypothetical protein|nr:hypothetical protein [Longimicrobium sp.]